MSACRLFDERAFRAAARAASLLLLCALLGSCGFRRSGIEAERAVRQFHARLDAGQLEMIYDQADDSFKTSTKKADFVANLRDIHSRLGKVRRTTTRGIQVNASPAQGSEVALAVETEFERGVAEERFLWHLQGDRAVLMDYRVDVKRSTGPTTV
ncbi:MAG: DUF4019 domain-containing protein [Spirochaetia bacterium]|jgi:hypothetical protein